MNIDKETRHDFSVLSFTSLIQRFPSPAATQKYRNQDIPHTQLVREVPLMNSKRESRRSLRLNGFNYSEQGAYFVTICTNKRNFVFGDIVERKMNINSFGKLAHQCWNDIPKHFPFVTVDEFIVMPNHVHGILFINQSQNNDIAARHAALTI
jgi:hypothetical protein